METVVRLRELDRRQAVDFVDRAEEALRELESDPQAGVEVRLGDRGSGAAGEAYRFFYRVRDGSVWIIGMC